MLEIFQIDRYVYIKTKIQCIKTLLQYDFFFINKMLLIIEIKMNNLLDEGSFINVYCRWKMAKVAVIVKLNDSNKR